MQIAPTINRVTNYSKLSKLLLLTIVLVAMLATMVAATAATPVVKANALLARMQVEGTNTYLNASMSFRAQESGNAASLKTGSAWSGTSGGWAQFNANFTKNWDGRITASIPAGYTPVADSCSQQDVYSPLGQGLMQNLPNGTYHTCTFVVRKIVAAPTYNAVATVTASPNQMLKPGDTTRITVSVKNTGTGTLNNVKIFLPPVLPTPYVLLGSIAPGATKNSIGFNFTIPANQNSDMTIDGGVNANELTFDVPMKVVLDVDGTKIASKDGMKVVTTFTALPKKVGDLISVSITVTNTGNTSLSNIVLSNHYFNKGKTSFATIPGLFAGWSQTITASTPWDGSNILASGHKLVVTATPLNEDGSPRPKMTWSS
jgi:hypothetical protein